MPKVRTSQLPSDALLSRYVKDGCHTDCYTADIPICISHEQFVLAFYTTTLFKMERLILKLAASRPSTDKQAAALADGQGHKFAAWSVEDRCNNQLLMCDFQGRTRSWLMTKNIKNADIPSTRLFFGSAVVPVRNKQTGEEDIGAVFRSLLGFHKIYSIALLSAAASKLLRDNE